MPIKLPQEIAYFYEISQVTERLLYCIPKEQLQLEITAYLVNQELVVPVRYWKGAVRIVGSSNGKDIHGHGYIELTDYSVTN